MDVENVPRAPQVVLAQHSDAAEPRPDKRRRPAVRGHEVYGVAVGVERQHDQRGQALPGGLIMPGELEASRPGVGHDPVPHGAETAAVRVAGQRQDGDAGRGQVVEVGLP